MNQKISWKWATLIIVAALGGVAFVYSRMPTGMVVHMTAKPGSVRGKPRGKFFNGLALHKNDKMQKGPAKQAPAKVGTEKTAAGTSAGDQKPG